MIDTRAYVEEIPALFRIDALMSYYRFTAIRSEADEHDLNSAHFLYEAQPITDRPKTAFDKRAHAVAVLGIAYYTSTDVDGMCAMLDRMIMMGRSASWKAVC